jgi:hypothetical protein
MLSKAWAVSDWKSGDVSQLPIKRQPHRHVELCPAIFSYCDLAFPWFFGVASHMPQYNLRTGSSLHPTNHRDLSQSDSHHVPHSQVTNAFSLQGDTSKPLWVHVPSNHPIKFPPQSKKCSAICSTVLSMIMARSSPMMEKLLALAQSQIYQVSLSQAQKYVQVCMGG